MEEKKISEPIASEEETEEMDGDIVELESEDGETVRFQHVATIDYENEWYVFFTPAEEMEGIDSDETVIFKLTTDENGADIFLPVEDEAILDAVYDEYLRIMEDEDSDWEECQCGDGCGDHCHHGDCDCKHEGEQEKKQGDCKCGGKHDCSCQNHKH